MVLLLPTNQNIAPFFNKMQLIGYESCSKTWFVVFDSNKKIPVPAAACTPAWQATQPTNNNTRPRPPQPASRRRRPLARLASQQCASKRDTEWTCGAFCADFDYDLFLSCDLYNQNLNFLEAEVLKNKKVFNIKVDNRDSSRRILTKIVIFRIDAKIKWGRHFETKDCFVHFRSVCETVFKNLIWDLAFFCEGHKK